MVRGPVLALDATEFREKKPPSVYEHSAAANLSLSIPRNCYVEYSMYMMRSVTQSGLSFEDLIGAYIKKKKRMLPSSTPLVLVGPVVGEVRNTRARVLLELDCRITVVAVDAASGEPMCAPVEFQANHPLTLTLRLPSTDAHYTVIFLGGSSRTPLQLDTGKPAVARFSAYDASDSTAELSFATLSCNNQSFSYPKPWWWWWWLPGRSAVDEWAQLARHIQQFPNSLRFVLHAGDCYYQDHGLEEEDTPSQIMACKSKSAYVLARRHLITTTVDGTFVNRPSSEWECFRGTIEELYKSTVRVTWGHPPNREVLASISNLFLPDDHEYRDDFGIPCVDRDPHSIETWLSAIAHKTVLAYQRSLWLEEEEEEEEEQEEKNATPESFGFARTYGRTKLLVLDTLMARTFQYDSGHANRYCGDVQWAWFEKQLCDGPSLLIISMPQPLFFLPRWFAATIGTLQDDLQQRLNSKQFGNECDALVRALRAWKMRSPERRIVILGGDIHISGCCTVTEADTGKPFALQLTTSGIKNGVASLEWAALATGMVASNLMKENVAGVTYHHDKYTSWSAYSTLCVPGNTEGPVANTQIAIYDQKNCFPHPLYVAHI